MTDVTPGEGLSLERALIIMVANYKAACIAKGPGGTDTYVSESKKDHQSRRVLLLIVC